MKKLIYFAICSLLVLSGCSSKPKTETKTCQLKTDDKSGLIMEATLNAKNDIVSKMIVTISLPFTADESSNATIEQQEVALEKMFLNSINITDKKGITVRSNIDERMEVSITINLNEVSDETKEKLTTNEDGKIKLSEKVKELEKGGMTCK